MIIGVVLGLAFSASAAAVPALADTSGTIYPEVVITDSITSGNVTGPDAIVNCPTSEIEIGGTAAIAVPVGCLTLYNGEWYKVSFVGGISTTLTMQDDANFVLYVSNGKVWGAATRYADDPANGPGCIAQFQGDANLVVRNCAGTAIWASGTHTYPDAILAFQQDGNLVIYASTTGPALWDTTTNS